MAPLGLHLDLQGLLAPPGLLDPLGADGVDGAAGPAGTRGG